MKYCRILLVVFTIVALQLIPKNSNAQIPVPDHVVVVVFENHEYHEIFGSTAAPYINSLFSDPKCALFEESYGLSHPSQPNYLQLYSGSNQGVTNNLLPAIFPFTTPNLGAALLANGRTFIGYSEGLPYVGSNVEVSGLYVRKHNPWVNWQGSGTNGVPSNLNQPFTAFPVDYNLLPTVSFVVPDLVNGMHDGTDPSRITIGDTWLQNNLGGYIQWAKTHNSLLIVTFDEDNGIAGQHILTFFIGEKVLAGTFSNGITHYNVLRMIEDMYSLPHSGAAATAATIDYCWSTCAVSPVITANGPLTFCQGGSVTLTASAGSSYLWSNGATTNAITVSTSGSYWVTVTYASSCTSTTSPSIVVVQQFNVSSTVFSESMGVVTGTTSVASHELANGFDNDSYTMSGTGDLRTSSASSTTNYPTASGGANVFLTNISGRNFIVSGINTSGLTGLELSFGIQKSTTASTGSDFAILVSSDGVNYTNLSFPSLPSGSGTATWHYRTASGVIPAVPNLRIQFRQNGTATQYRIDDILLKNTVSVPSISASGPTNFCQGSSVLLTSTTLPAYNWSNGATTSSITATITGNYFVSVSDGNGCTASSNIIAVNTVAPPSILSFSPDTAVVGNIITVNGTGFTDATSVLLNGIATVFNVVNATLITFIVPSNASSGNVFVSTPCGSSTSATSLHILQQSSLQLRVLIQGLYIGGEKMNTLINADLCDTINVVLHDSNSPYNPLITVIGILDTSGFGNFMFPAAYSGTAYYIVVQHRNSLETWSASPVFLSSTGTSFDFTSSPAQAYGGNQFSFPDGKAVLYSGDVDQDGSIDHDDYLLVETAMQLFLVGYHREDLNGDRILEAADFSLVENNSQLSLIVNQP